MGFSGNVFCRKGLYPRELTSYLHSGNLHRVSEKKYATYSVTFCKVLQQQAFEVMWQFLFRLPPQIVGVRLVSKQLSAPERGPTLQMGKCPPLPWNAM